jgi:hypothetical protein
MKQLNEYAAGLGAKKGLLAVVFVAAVGFVLPASAQVSCTITVSSGSDIGKKKENDSHLYATLSSIDRIVSYDLKKDSNSCPSSAFRISGNILTVLNDKDNDYTCIATVTVEGKKTRLY